MKNKFCIRTRGPDHSKQIIDTLVRLGYNNKEAWGGNKRIGYYGVDEKNEIIGNAAYDNKYPEIQLEGLEEVNKLIYNYNIL